MNEELSHIITDIRSLLDELGKINNIEHRKEMIYYGSREKYKTLRLQERLLSYMSCNPDQNTKEITVYDFMIRLTHNNPC